jgi:K+-transporting ATPase c subunit
MKTLRACAVITSLLLLLCCGAYPFAVTAAAQASSLSRPTAA